MTTENTTPETANAPVATQGMVSVTDRVKVEIPHDAEAAPAIAGEDLPATAPEAHADKNADDDPAGQGETTASSDPVSEELRPDATPSEADIEPLDQKLNRLRKECMALGAEAQAIWAF